MYLIRPSARPIGIAYAPPTERPIRPVTEIPSETPSAATPAASDVGLDEIIVTAQKRAESLQKTPLSATAFGDEQLEARGITSFGDMISGSIPSLRVAPFVGRASSFVVSIYIDGVYLGRVQGLGTELFEIERMEVLRGPQGTLFGRNAVGGAVNIISKKPTGEFGIDQVIEVSNYDGRGLVTHLNLPKFAGISIKIDGVLKRRDGWVENPLDGAKDWNAYSRRGIRVAALWEPSDTFSLLYSFDKSRDASVNSYDAIGQQLVPGSGFGPLIALEPNRVTRGRLGAPLEPSIGKVEGHGLTATWDVNDDLQIKSITAYRKLSQDQYDQAAGAFFGFSPNALFGRVSASDVHQDQFSQELQIIGSLDRLKYTLGAFYYEEDADDSAYAFRTLRWNATGTDYTVLDTPVGGPPPDRSSINHAKSTALFGQLTYTPPLFDDRIHITGGLRYTKDKKRGQLTALRGVPQSLAYRFSSSRVDPSASLSFEASNATQLYARWGVAYRAGGANSRSATFRTYEEEEVETEFWNRRGRFNIAAFDMRYRDIQSDFSNPTNPSNVETVNTNGSTKVKGVEVDVALRPFQGLTLDATYSYLHPKVPLTRDPFRGTPVTTFLTFAPKHTAAGAIDYRFNETSVGTPFLHLDGSYATGSYSLPTQPYKTDSYFTTNGRLGLDDISLGENAGSLRVSLWMKNIFNEEHTIFRNVASSGAGTTNAIWHFYNTPRTYGLELNYKF